VQPFEIIDHTADVGIAAYGATIEELFANAARGMLSIVGELATVEPREARRVRAEAPEREGLLAAFLAELLYLLEVERFVTRDADVERVTDTEVCATVHGEPIAPHHELHTEIKAVTHHDLRIEKHGEGWRATVLFDI